MKTAKRVLAVLMAMVMAASVFAVAASAANTLQTLIDDAAPGATVTMPANTTESVTITKDLTLNLGGKTLKGVAGSSAIVVKDGAKVTITNGCVESYFYDYHGFTADTLEILKELWTKNRSAIVARGNGTEVTLTDVHVNGGLVRVPKTQKSYIPMGSALQMDDGADAVLNNAVLFGDYGVNNAVSGGYNGPGGTLTVNDALIFGYMDYVKDLRTGRVVYDENTVEKVNAADRITGYLNKHIKLEPKELNVLEKVLDDRAYIFTTKPTDDAAIVNINYETGVARITAAEIKDLAYSACSYKYIPENAYDAATGKTFALNTDIPAAAVDGKEIRINYRLAFELKGFMKTYLNNFGETFDHFYGRAFDILDEVVPQLKGALDVKVGELADVFDTLDTNGAKTITLNGQTQSMANLLGDDFFALERELIAFGGVRMYNETTAGKAIGGFTTNVFKQPLYANGAAAPAAGTYKTGREYSREEIDFETGDPVTVTWYEVTELGLFDKLMNMIDAFLAIKGDDSFADQDNWVEMAQYIVDNYQAFLDLFAEAEAKLVDFRTLVTTGNIGSAISQSGMDEELTMLNDLIAILSKANEVIDKALTNPIVADLKGKIDRNAHNGSVEEYVGKIKNFANNYRAYVTPENFLLENGAYLKAYRVTGPTKVEIIERGKLNIEVAGSGVVAYTPDNGVAGETDSMRFVGLGYDKTITLVATPNQGNEFLYYVNTDTGRILSTDPTLVIDTQIERYIDAVFESVNLAKVVFTSSSGIISDIQDYADEIDTTGIETYLACNYDPMGWGPNGGSTLKAADYVSAYLNGNSAFENGAVYNSLGYAFKLNGATENKYLATPKFDSKVTFNVSFLDDGEEWSNEEVPAGTALTYTAKGDNFSYWMLRETEQIVSIYPTYTVQALQDMELEAVYGADEIPTASMAIVGDIYEDTRIVVYAERSIAPEYKVKTTGFLVSFSDSIMLPEISDVDRTNVLMTVSTKKTNQGVASVAITYNTLNAHDGVCYVRAFTEYQTAEGGIAYEYSDVTICEA